MSTADELLGEATDSFEPKVQAFAAAHRLSEREREILSLLLQGVPPKAMPDALGCGYASIRTHLTRMCRKLGCSGSLELVLKFFRGAKL